ncbi:MAG: hypothetical protein A3H93_08045 [Rhodocyclales bacterium RIFCSPLOWO2_02_FULL_63_24]|nr:MAG: hypothetical protein A2045_03180 [Rhodocyclales bacterium GWA2_65_20]OHC69323.1 MAG: hypothetical protein A3H93_08045 [Rhodocyclales bacterium RIFCSPLOWO2_02_FULL_63_24]
MSEDMQLEQPPARMVAGALAHLARHMETGCARAGHLAAMLLDQVANDPEADGHLRAHARDLVEILERDALLGQAGATAASANNPAGAQVPSRKAIARP